MLNEHTHSYLKSIYYIQALRIKLICSASGKYKKHSEKLMKKFVEKSNKEFTVRKQIKRIYLLDRTLKTCKSK